MPRGASSGLAATAAAAETPLERGRYLVQSIVACGNCHTPQGPDGPLPDKELAGEVDFIEPGIKAYAANITPSNLARFSDAELKKIITAGVRPDGSRLEPPMGVPYDAKTSAADLDALVAYLRTLPRK